MQAAEPTVDSTKEAAMGAMTMWMKKLGPRKTVALMMAPGALTLGVDATIAHFAGRPAHHPAQLLPVLFAPVAAVLLGWVAQAHVPEATLRRMLRGVGAAGLLLGGAGTTFHLRALGRLMEAPFRMSDLVAALAVAPPLFAPAAFAGIGGLLWALASPRLELGVHDPAEAPELRHAA